MSSAELSLLPELTRTSVVLTGCGASFVAPPRTSAPPRALALVVDEPCAWKAFRAKSSRRGVAEVDEADYGDYLAPVGAYEPAGGGSVPPPMLLDTQLVRIAGICRDERRSWSAPQRAKFFLLYNLFSRDFCWIARAMGGGVTTGECLLFYRDEQHAALRRIGLGTPCLPLSVLVRLPRAAGAASVARSIVAALCPDGDARSDAGGASRAGDGAAAAAAESGDDAGAPLTLRMPLWRQQRGAMREAAIASTSSGASAAAGEAILEAWRDGGEAILPRCTPLAEVAGAEAAEEKESAAAATASLCGAATSSSACAAAAAPHRAAERGAEPRARALERGALACCSSCKRAPGGAGASSPLLPPSLLASLPLLLHCRGCSLLDAPCPSLASHHLDAPPPPRLGREFPFLYQSGGREPRPGRAGGARGAGASSAAAQGSCAAAAERSSWASGRGGAADGGAFSGGGSALHAASPAAAALDGGFATAILAAAPECAAAATPCRQPPLLPGCEHLLCFECFAFLAPDYIERARLGKWARAGFRAAGLLARAADEAAVELAEQRATAAAAVAPADARGDLERVRGAAGLLSAPARQARAASPQATSMLLDDGGGAGAASGAAEASNTVSPVVAAAGGGAPPDPNLMPSHAAAAEAEAGGEAHPAPPPHSASGAPPAASAERGADASEASAARADASASSMDAVAAAAAAAAASPLLSAAEVSEAVEPASASPLLSAADSSSQPAAKRQRKLSKPAPSTERGAAPAFALDKPDKPDKPGARLLRLAPHKLAPYTYELDSMKDKATVLGLLAALAEPDALHRLVAPRPRIFEALRGAPVARVAAAALAPASEWSFSDPAARAAERPRTRLVGQPLPLWEDGKAMAEPRLLASLWLFLHKSPFYLCLACLPCPA